MTLMCSQSDQQGSDPHLEQRPEMKGDGRVSPSQTRASESELFLAGLKGLSPGSARAVPRTGILHIIV